MNMEKASMGLLVIFVIFLLIIGLVFYSYFYFNKIVNPASEVETKNIEGLPFVINYGVLFGLGSSGIYVNGSSGEIVYSSEVEGGYLRKGGTISLSDIQLLFNLVKNLPQFESSEVGDIYLNVWLEESRIHVKCISESECPEDVAKIINELKLLSRAVFEKSCSYDPDCSNIFCESGNFLLGQGGLNESAKCRIIEGNERCSCSEYE